MVITRSELLRLLREAGKVPEGGCIFVVEVERGDEVLNVNDVDGIVVSWGSIR